MQKNATIEFPRVALLRTSEQAWVFTLKHHSLPGASGHGARMPETDSTPITILCRLNYSRFAPCLGATPAQTPSSSKPAGMQQAQSNLGAARATVLKWSEIRVRPLSRNDLRRRLKGRSDAKFRSQRLNPGSDHRETGSDRRCLPPAAPYGRVMNPLASSAFTPRTTWTNLSGIWSVRSWAARSRRSGQAAALRIVRAKTSRPRRSTRRPWLSRFGCPHPWK